MYWDIRNTFGNDALIRVIASGMWVKYPSSFVAKKFGVKFVWGQGWPPIGVVAVAFVQLNSLFALPTWAVVRQPPLPTDNIGQPSPTMCSTRKPIQAAFEETFRERLQLPRWLLHLYTGAIYGRGHQCQQQRQRTWLTKWQVFWTEAWGEVANMKKTGIGAIVGRIGSSKSNRHEQGGW